MINNLFAGMLGNSVFAYLDNLTIVSKNPETLKNLIYGSSAVTGAGLKVKLAKCEFLNSKLKFLGHEVDGEGIHTSDDKITAVKNFYKPQGVDNVRCFLELGGYYRPFIHKFAAKVAPLTRLLRKESTFHLGAT